MKPRTISPFSRALIIDLEDNDDSEGIPSLDPMEHLQWLDEKLASYLNRDVDAVQDDYEIRGDVTLKFQRIITPTKLEVIITAHYHLVNVPTVRCIGCPTMIETPENNSINANMCPRCISRAEANRPAVATPSYGQYGTPAPVTRLVQQAHSSDTAAMRELVDAMNRQRR